jgi:hypothetical protein
MRKKFVLTEEDRKHILGLYNLLNEQDNENQLNISQKVLFPPGYYNQSYIVDTLNPIIERVRTFLSTNREIPYTIDIVISASESRIPNTDKEQGGTIVDPGYLSGKRQETIENYLKGNLNSLVEEGLLSSVPTYTKTEPTIGNTPWVGTPFCPQNADDNEQRGGCKQRYDAGIRSGNREILDYKEKYDNEQNVTLTINIVRTPEPQELPEDCVNGMTIELNYEKGDHICDSSVYQLYANYVDENSLPLLRDDGKDYASLNNYTPKNRVGKSTHGLSRKEAVKLQQYDNNLGDRGGKRYNKFIITNEMAKELMSGDKKVITISAKCYNPLNYFEDGKQDRFNLGLGDGETYAWGLNCHDDVGEIKVTNAKGLTQKFTSRKTPNKKDEVVKMFTFDPCTLERITSLTKTK